MRTAEPGLPSAAGNGGSAGEGFRCRYFTIEQKGASQVGLMQSAVSRWLL